MWGDVAGGRREVEEDEDACFTRVIHNEEAVGDLQCDGVFCKLTEGGDRAQTELGSRSSFQDLSAERKGGDPPTVVEVIRVQTQLF